jgi:hypothetical protein
MSERAPKQEKAPKPQGRVAKHLGRIAYRLRTGETPEQTSYRSRAEITAKDNARSDQVRRKVSEAKKRVTDSAEAIKDKLYGEKLKSLRDALASKVSEESAQVVDEGSARITRRIEKKMNPETEMIGSSKEMGINMEDEWKVQHAPAEHSVQREAARVEAEQESVASEFGVLAGLATRSVRGGEVTGVVIGQQEKPEARAVRLKGNVYGGGPRLEGQYGWNGEAVDLIYETLGAERPRGMTPERRIEEREKHSVASVETVTPSGVRIVETWRIGQRDDEYAPVDSYKGSGTPPLTNIHGARIEGEIHHINFYPPKPPEAEQSPEA